MLWKNSWHRCDRANLENRRPKLASFGRSEWKKGKDAPKGPRTEAGCVQQAWLAILLDLKQLLIHYSS